MTVNHAEENAPSSGGERVPGDRSGSDDAGATAAGARGGTRSARSGILLVVCAALVYGLDQLTKWWVVATMTEGQITPVLPPLLSWRFIRNPGAAFSIGTDYTWVFTIIMVLVSIVLVLQVRRVASRLWGTALGLVLGGALGNLTDRLFREPSFGQGHVVDFVALPNFAIFNVADSAVVSGVVLIVILTLRGVGMDGTRDTDAADDGAGAGEDTDRDR